MLTIACHTHEFSGLAVAVWSSKAATFSDIASACMPRINNFIINTLEDISLA